MEPGLISIRARWNVVRVISSVQVAFTSILMLLAIPGVWWMLALPVFTIAVTGGIVFVALWRRALIWLTLLSQVVLFTMGLLDAVFASTGQSMAPLLLLAFSMFLAEEYVLKTIARYSTQFSWRDGDPLWIFNGHALHTSLSDLFRKFAFGEIIFGAGFLVSVIIATVSAFGRSVWLLSDPGLYAIAVSISLALLIAIKNE